MQKPNFQFYNFIKPAFADKTQHTLIRAARRTGKTYWAFQRILLMLMKNRGSMWLWVDTVQGNIIKYIDRYVRPIMGDFWDTVKVDYQKYVLHFMNESKLDLWSWERPENLEWFWYDFYVLNEAWIILKKKERLWDETIHPMVKSARWKIIGTPKWKTENKYFEMSNLAQTESNFAEYHYTAFDSPERTDEQLEQVKAQVPSYIRQQEYLAEFVDVYEDSLLTPDDIQYYDYIDLNTIDTMYMHCDTTHTWKETSDFFCAVVLWEAADKNFYVVDFILEKMDVEKQARSTISLYSKYSNKIAKLTYDEKANQGFWFWIKYLAKNEYNISLPIEELKYPNDKVTHFTPHVPHFKANRVLLPKSNHRINIATDQLLAFPNKDVHDDFVDWMSWVLDNFNKEEIDWDIYIG